MTVNHHRPVNLDLGSLKFPPMAIASILHRISGLVLFILLPIMMYFLSQSLASRASYDHLQVLLTQFHIKLLFWAFTTALLYHVLAGLRHIVMDMGFGEQLVVARRSSMTVILIAFIMAIFLGIWIC